MANGVALPAAGGSKPAAAAEKGAVRGLKVVVGHEYEEALELRMEVVVPYATVKNFRVELTIDRNPEQSAKDVSPVPPPTAVVKRMDMGPESPAMIQNMPSGRHFLVAVVAVMSTGREVRSGWVPARTLPFTKATPPARDILGNWRGQCRGCPCLCFKLMHGNQFSLNTNPANALCRGCGCQADMHEKFERGSDLEEDMLDVVAQRRRSGGGGGAAAGAGGAAAGGEGDGKAKDGTAADEAKEEIRLPAESGGWSSLEKELYVLSHGDFHPGKMANRRRLPANLPEEAPERTSFAERPAAANSTDSSFTALVQGASRWATEIEALERTLGPEHADTISRLNLAALMYAQGRHSEAAPILRSELELVESRLGAQSPELVKAVNRVALLLQAMAGNSEGGTLEAEDLPDPPAGQQGGSSSSSSSGGARDRGSAVSAAGGRQGARGRISVVCPTMESRRVFHEQLWNVFEAQLWPDKELIVVETYKIRPSPFLLAKAKDDPRLIYVGLQVRHSQGDLSIGLKRNMCTHLASGEILANFDDDDVYAPSYLRTMAEALREGNSAGATLASWYVFDVDCGKFGFVDPVKAKELGQANAPRDIDDWLYGYGFSYVFTLEAACAHPYSNRNLGEDMEFFSALRRPSRGGVKLVFDSYGICVHTLHSRSTSNNWAQREVMREELEDLDVVDLADVLLSYFMRFPTKKTNSDFIEAKIERKQRKLRVATAFGEFSVKCNAGVRAQDVLELLAKQVGSIARDGRVFRAPADDSAAAGDNVAASGIVPTGDALARGDRVGLRTERLYVDLATQGKEVLVKIVDLGDRSMSVSVKMPHSMVTVQAVREALIAQHAPPGSRAKPRDIRIAEGVSNTFVAVESTRWLGEARSLFSPGLAEFLGRKRAEEKDPR